MHPKMAYWMPHSTQPFLLKCDINLVKEALAIILNPYAENSAPPESLQIAHALNNYLAECNNAFLACERIRLFLLLSLLASLVISLIALATLPVSAVSVTLICMISFILFSVNIFTLYHQMSGYQQEIDWNKLKKICSDYTEKCKSAYGLNKPLGSISSPTSDPCLFSTRKIPQKDETNTNADEERLNNSEHRLSPIDEESLEKTLNYIKFSGLKI
jgi:hypothetical protein